MDEAEIIHAEIVDRVGAAEGLRPESVVPLHHMTTGEPLGEAATITGMNIDKAVGFDLAYDLDGTPQWTRNFYVFARSVSLVPHLLVEWIGPADDDPENLVLLADLLPRIDLAVNLDYVDDVYAPLTSVFHEARALEGVRVVPVAPRRAVAMSPWRLSLSVPSGQIKAVGSHLDEYVSRWLTVNSTGVDTPVDPLASDQARLVQHDRYHRNSLFDAESDPYWGRIDRLLGMDAAAELRHTLRSQRER